MNHQDFASCLHNPWGYPTPIENAAIMVFKRRGRFLDGYSIHHDIYNLIVKHFGDVRLLHRDGLDKHYKELAEEVKSNKLIGLILYGADINNIVNNSVGINNNINTYTTNTNTKIDLTICSICQHLVEDYIKPENVDVLCKETPDFEIYYNNSDNS